MLAREDGTHAIWATETLGPEEAEEQAANLAQEMLGRVGPLRPATPPAVYERPLVGLSLLVTRPGTPATSFEAELIAAGAMPVSAPLITITPPADSQPIDDAIVAIGAKAYDWVVFTSGNAVDGLCTGLILLVIRRTSSRRLGLPLSVQQRSGGWPQSG